MTNFSVIEKNKFTVLGIGTELKSDYTDYAGVEKEKSDFWEKVNHDGTIEKLKNIASNNYLFVVNEAYNNKMMHYVGVMTKETLPEATRMIEFPEGEYIVVEGEAGDDKELIDTLTGKTFGEVLMKVTEVAYVGGPNAAVVMEERDGGVYGEMWVPVVRK